MRVVSHNSSDAFAYGKKFSSSNTKVTVEGDIVKLFLFDKHIATKDGSGKITITNAGWPTSTTVDRLRSIGANVNLSGGKRGQHRSGTMYLNGYPMKNDVWYDIDYAG